MQSDDLDLVDQILPYELLEILIGLPFFDPLKFPAINIRTRRGTIVLFQTGAINIMGLKSKRDVLYFARLISSKSAKC